VGGRAIFIFIFDFEYGDKCGLKIKKFKKCQGKIFNQLKIRLKCFSVVSLYIYAIEISIIFCSMVTIEERIVT